MAKTTPDNPSQPTSVMAQLLAKQKITVPSFHRGDVVDGVITKLTRSEILIDIKAKSEAVVVERDKKLLGRLLAQLHQGDTVAVVVLNPESENGNPLVSLRRFLENDMWTMLEKAQKEDSQIEVQVTDSTKGGFMVQTPSGIAGFLPNSHVSFQSGGQTLVGKTVSVVVLELNRPENKIVFSQKGTLSDSDFSAITKQFKVGQKITSTITNIASFGVFTAIQITRDGKEDQIDGFLHISEVAWEKIDDLATRFKAGQTLEAIVNRFDTDSKRIELSLKRLTIDPFDEIAKAYPVEKRVSGEIMKVTSDFVTISLGEGKEGYIRKEKIPPNMVTEVGKTINAVVSEIDSRRRRIILIPVLLEKPIGYR